MTDIKAKWKSLTEPARASLAAAGGRFFLMGIAFISTPVFTRLMTTEEYGTYTVIMSWVEVISVFATLNLVGGSFQQALVKFNDQKSDLIASIAGLGTTVSLITLGIYFLLKRWLDPLFGFGGLIFSCIIILSWAGLMSDIWTDYQKIEYRYKAKIFVSILVAVAETLIGIAAVCMAREYKGEVRFFTVVIVKTIIFGSFFVYFMTKGKLYDKKLWRYFLSLSIPLLPHYLTWIVLNQSDRIMIKSLVGESEAGIYGLGRNLAWMLWLITSAIIYSMKPWLYKRIKAKELDGVGKNIYVMLALVAVAGTGIVLVAPEALYILAPLEYNTAASVIAPLTASVYFIFMYELFSCFEFYHEKTGMITIASLAAGILNIVLNYFCIRKFGWIAAGYTTLICYACLAIIHYVNMSKILKKTDNTGVINPLVILLISAAFIGISSVMSALHDHIAIRYGIVLIALIVLVIKRKAVKGLIDPLA
ncbi:MAG: oligosaccharide flippase family protein [Lachnospiraceae bacterium]|nr:oligosaccharide flippase family protein [Lachnospiraceae bacterium]